MLSVTTMRKEKSTTLLWLAVPWGLQPIARYMTVWSWGNFSQRSDALISLILLGASEPSGAGSNSRLPMDSNFSYKYKEYVLTKADMSRACGVEPSL